MKGLIFDIKELALFDGPGIRTTVFLKGCPLSCSWCHNPEGINHEVEVMRVKVVCPECGESTFSDSVCTHCTASLPKNMISPPRITGQWIESEKLAQQLLKDRAILEKNGGGVTFSGGEPLFQASFLLEVITHLEGLHTAIETSGFASEA